VVSVVVVSVVVVSVVVVLDVVVVSPEHANIRTCPTVAHTQSSLGGAYPLLQ
jgi:hypothetical protein